MKTRRVTPLLLESSDIYTYKDRYMDFFKYLQNIVQTKEATLKKLKVQFLDHLIILKNKQKKQQQKKQTKNRQNQCFDSRLKIQAGCYINLSIDNQNDQSSKTQSININGSSFRSLLDREPSCSNTTDLNNQILKRLDYKGIKLNQQINKLSLQVYKLYQEKEGVVHQIYDQLCNKQNNLKKVLDKLLNQSQAINISKLSCIWRSVSLKNDQHLNDELLTLHYQIDPAQQVKLQNKNGSSVSQQKKIINSKHKDKTCKLIMNEDKNIPEIKFNKQKQQKVKELAKQKNKQKPVFQNFPKLQNITRLSLTLHDNNIFGLSRISQNKKLVKQKEKRQTNSDLNLKYVKKNSLDVKNQTIDETIRKVCKRKSDKKCQLINLISSTSNATNSETQQQQTQARNKQSEKDNNESYPMQSELRESMKKNISRKKRVLKYIQILD